MQVVKVGELPIDPLVGVDLDVGLFSFACARQVSQNALVYLVTLLLIIEAKK